jgi:hypothetical protein
MSESWMDSIVSLSIFIHTIPHRVYLQAPAIPCPSHWYLLIHPLRTPILRTNRESLAFTRRLVRHLEHIDQVLLVRDGEVDLVVVARAEVDLDVFVSPEKHDRT